MSRGKRMEDESVSLFVTILAAFIYYISKMF